MYRKLSLWLLASCLLITVSTASFGWKFVVLGDTQGSNYGCNTAELAKIVSMVNLENADFVIHNGDTTDGSDIAATQATYLANWASIMNQLNCNS